MKKLNKIICLTIIAFLFVSLCLCAYGCTIINAMNKETNNEHYNSLTAEEKAEYDSKLIELKESSYYKSLSKKEKSSLIDKFIESEKTLKSVASDPVDKSPEEIQQKIDELTANGATVEEIQAAEQEKDYWKAVDIIKQITTESELLALTNPGKEITIRKVNGFFDFYGSIYILAELMMGEKIDNKTYYTFKNALCSIPHETLKNTTLKDIIDAIASSKEIYIEELCNSSNSAEYLDYFAKNDIVSKANIQHYIDDGYSLKIEESWKSDKDKNHPKYIISLSKNNKSKMYFVEYGAGGYKTNLIERICPEFWAQLAIENAKNNG